MTAVRVDPGTEDCVRRACCPAWWGPPVHPSRPRKEQDNGRPESGVRARPSHRSGRGEAALRQHPGLYLTREEPDKLYFKGWDEWDHHSVVLEAGGVGVVKFGFKVFDPAELDLYEARALRLGFPVERMSAGDNPEVSDGIRCILPNQHVVELYHAMTPVGLEVGTHNPDAFPRHLVGIGGPALDHALMMGDDVEGAQRFFTDVLDFLPDRAGRRLTGRRRAGDRILAECR